MRKSNAIKWEEFPNALTILDDYQLPIFEKYFLGDYMRDSYAITEAATGLNNFLKSLTKQERDIFLQLKGSFGKAYITDKTFIEVLNYCLPRTNTNIQSGLLHAIKFIIVRHEKSREKLIQDPKSLEKIANTESKLKGLAIEILQTLRSEYIPPIETQYSLQPNASYQFYMQFREIIKDAKGYIYVVDNYANHVIFDYIDSICDTAHIQDIKILTVQNIKDLKLAKQHFESQYSHIHVEIKTSNKYHDRYLFFDGEEWFMGPSIKDGGRKACSIVQLKGQAASDALNTFHQVWNSANTI